MQFSKNKCAKLETLIFGFMVKKFSNSRKREVEKKSNFKEEDIVQMNFIVYFFFLKENIWCTLEMH